jgi:long-subunit acyl-CoA synthetase (AMP-forming)
MKGYLNEPEKTLDCLTPDGWLSTGDIVTMDERGFVTICDRLKELIKYKGFQV